ncbi:uncharacterized protein LOC129456343 isoform X1 [Periophthalmus magnuspinnatus]|uniref:uncharacterized protein LOC129456343 isoform X1 n=1 Tax=Periophthalmus magnuspinnatus TaxID=409849 RepID=UPI002436FD96|nr:uncharacterized protein LOC129456343 isoform X1 [Periophthalmus magnuspinnatus]XP_055078641.1 uncharacterized protein LOC129456343 isoform X1 [Periophthalmus magnuspinnatus]
MRRYWLPDYERKIIGELQRQQNSAQFCDTLLQTEGISIPTHSSVLAALSQHLSQRLSASPSYPAGTCKLQLHALKPQILIKLIGLLYSGELEVSGAMEQRDVLAAAHLFGLPDLVEGEKVEVRNHHNGCKDCKRIEFEKRDAQIQATPRSFCVSIGTQTITEDPNQTMENFEHQETTPLSTVPQSCSSVETTCSVNSKTYSEEEFILEQSTSATVSLSCPNETMSLHLSPSEESICSRLQEGAAQPTQPETSVECIIGSPVVVEEEEKEDRQRKVPKDKEKTNQEAGNEGASVVEKRQVHKKVATKSLEKMQEMMETTQISIKVKLRRRGTKEEIWEVVNLQDPGALSGATSLKTDSCKMSQGDLTAAQPSPSTDQAPESVTSSPKPGPHTSNISESVSAPNGDPVPLQLSHPVEETDEQMEKLLEDIMIGLNILPNIDKRNDKSRDLDQSPEGFGDQNGNCSTETDESGCTVRPPSKPCGTKSDLSLNNPCTSDGRRDSPQNSPCPTTSPCLLKANPGLNPPEDPNVPELLPLSTENEDNLFSIADLQFLPCLSPLDSNNNSSDGNKTPAHFSLPGRTWLMDKPRSLQFPLTAVVASTSSGCKEAGSNDKPVGQLGEKQKVSVCTKLDNDGTSRSAKSRCPNLGLNKICKQLKVKTDANINFSHCLVSLSSNNVLAKERKSPTSPLPSNLNELQTQITRRLRPKTKMTGDTLRKTPIRTRRKSQNSHSTPEKSYPNPEMSKNDRKRERPRKRAANRDKSEQKIKNTSLKNSDEVPNQAKRLRLEEDIDDEPSKQVMPIDSSFDAKTDDNSIVTAEKRPRMVSLKDLQELIKCKHLKTQGTKGKSEKEQSEKAENSERGNAVMVDSVWETGITKVRSDEIDVIEDGDEQPLSSLLSNQLSNAPKTPPPVDNSTSSISDFNNLSENSDESEICVSVIPEKVTKVSEEMEEATPKLIDDGVTDSASENELTIDDSFQHINSSNLCESKNGDSENSKETDPSTRGSGCLQDDEEDMDVDVLFHSPDRTFVTTEGQKSVKISHDEEKEEDSIDVDVTGSETD